MNTNNSFKQVIIKEASEIKMEDQMRRLANHLIDRFLEDKKNNRLKFISQKNNIQLEGKDNYGTQ